MPKHKSVGQSRQGGFDIHASVVFRLGEELITDEIQALVELIKNSYDADASTARVVINTEDALDEKYHYEGAKGYIIIEDDGVGMTDKTIKDGWLLISNSPKRKFKELGLLTPKFGRTPLGDKGLGRLGVQRLGSNVEIITRPEGQNIEYHVAFSWSDFEGEARLSEIPVYFQEVESTSKHGTTLVISDLKNLNIWQGTNAVAELQTSVSRMISPFSKIRNFQIVMRVNGKLVRLAELADELRQTAQIRYEIKFIEEIFSIRGYASLAYLSPQPQSEQQLFYDLVITDSGEQFLKFLQSKPLGKDCRIRRANLQGWYLEYGFEAEFTSFPGLIAHNDKLANPGDFEGEVDYFDFREGAEQQNVFDQAAEYKEYIKSLSGISVYRDGFGIRVDRDWLNLGAEATSGRSRYVLKPANTIGYIAISSSQNSNLKELTNREGFIRDAYYYNFYTMLSRFVKFSGNTQNFIKRSWIEFRDEYIKSSQQSEVEDTSPKGVTAHIQKEARKYRRKLEQNVQKLEGAQSESEPSSQLSLFPEPQNTTDKTKAVFEENIEVTKQVVQYLASLEGETGLTNILQIQFERLQTQLSETYETMGLGLTAEALFHEFYNVTEQLSFRTEQIVKYLRDKKNTDAFVLSYIEHVRSSILALHKQLSHFTPALKYLRAERDDINILNFLNDADRYYESRLKDKNILIRIENHHDFTININRGKLTQILDNMILNSEYWLTEDMRLNFIERGIITIQISQPVVRVADNGRGINRAVEESLFEPFITMKEAGKGRGLGLFIVRQLLDSEGCLIRLLPERNAFGNLNIFEIDFSKRIQMDVRN